LSLGFGENRGIVVRFPFRIGKAFLDYDWHPITIPKAHYRNLERQGLVEESVSIESPFNSMSGSIVYSRAGYGPYYQIRMDGGQSRDRMSQFKLGEQIIVELERVGKKVRVTLRRA
jgi:hypothetical protein